MFSRLKKTDALLSRVFTMLLALSSSPDALTTVDSCGLTHIFHQLQQLLHRALSSRPHNSDREQALEDCYYKLRDYADRLDVSLFFFSSISTNPLPYIVDNYNWRI